MCKGQLKSPYRVGLGEEGGYKRTQAHTIVHIMISLSLLDLKGLAQSRVWGETPMLMSNFGIVDSV